MADVGRHPKIKLMTLSEVENVSGYVGNFTVQVRRKARYVDERQCTSCGECVPVCPVLKPDEFQVGLATRKAIYKAFPQAIPAAYLIDMNDCLGNNPVSCNKCVMACDKHCIDLNMTDKIVELKVGAIIVATGLDVYNPAGLPEYGYSRLENVVTSLEFERLICAGGPADGHLVRPGDGKTPRRIGFIQCVGSRTARSGHEYCSNVCCMNSVKDSLLLKDHYPETEVYVFYIDIRAFGKGFEELYNRSKKAGVRYIRGLPDVLREDPDTGNILVRVENTTAGVIEEFELELVVLAVALEKAADADKLRTTLGLSQTADGFLMEAHPKLMPVDAPTRGIFLAGCVEAPKDIKDSVTQGSAAASRASIILGAGSIKLEAATASVYDEQCTSCEVCVRVCPYGAISADRKQKIPADITTAKCAGCGACSAECQYNAIKINHFDDSQYYAQIEAALQDDPGRQLLVFACTWCSYAAADLAGSSRLQYPPNARLIRTMCSVRVDEAFVMHAFKLGAPAVLVSGCHLADCHYLNANRWTVKRMDRLWNRMESLGIRVERLQLEWMSAAEGQKFARVMHDMEKLRQGVTEAEIQHTRKAIELYQSKKKGALSGV